MQTYKRICLKNYEIEDDDGKTFTLERGKEYLTSGVNAAPSIGPSPIENHVIVFSSFWIPVPLSVFGGEIEFTKA